MRFRKSLVVVMALASSIIASSAVVLGQDPTPLSEIPVQSDVIGVSALAYNATNGALLVGSLSGGTVHTVNADGTLTALVTDEALTSTRNLVVNASTNRLYVINSSAFGGVPEGFDPAQLQLPEGVTLPEGFDPANMQPPAGFDPSQMQLPEGVTLPEGFDPAQFQGMMNNNTIGLLVYDLATGTQALNVDLTSVAPTGRRLPNAITLDTDGNAYITDGAAGVIYRVDTAGNTAFLSDTRFTSEDGISLTGIVYHASGSLLVTKADGNVFRIPLNDPTNVQLVTISGASTNITAFALLEDGRAVTLDSQTNMLSILTSTDAWATATISGTIPAPEGTTSITTDGTTLYLLNGGFGTGMIPGMFNNAANGTPAEIPPTMITQLEV